MIPANNPCVCYSRTLRFSVDLVRTYGANGYHCESATGQYRGENPSGYCQQPAAARILGLSFSLALSSALSFINNVVLTKSPV